MIIIRNAIRCNFCGDVVESKHTHHFVTCSKNPVDKEDH